MSGSFTVVSSLLLSTEGITSQGRVRLGELRSCSIQFLTLAGGTTSETEKPEMYCFRAMQSKRLSRVFMCPLYDMLEMIQSLLTGSSSCF